jgi:hypothetical protein
VAIFQHSLPFLQSESFQTHVGTIHRRAIGPLAHHNSASAYSPSLCAAPTIECLHRPRYKLTCSSRQSVALRITSNLYSFSDLTSPTSSFQIPFISLCHIHSNVSILIVVYATMLLVYIVIRKYCCVTKETQMYYCIVVALLTLLNQGNLIHVTVL